MGSLSEVEAALRVRLSPRLLRWFTSYAAKSGSDRKLPCTKKNGEYFFNADELDEFVEFLQLPWSSPDGKRHSIPTAILSEIKTEAGFQCAVCGHGNDGEAAHIVPWAESKSNHPGNLLWTCPNHHTAYDHGHRVHATLDAGSVRDTKLRLIESQERRWRIEYRAVLAVTLLIQEVESLRSAIKKHKTDAFADGLLASAERAVHALKKASSAESAGGPEAVRKKMSRVSSRLSEEAITPVALDEIVEAKNESLEESGLKPCPVCKGAGTFGDYDVCPACGGEAFLDHDEIALVDEASFELVKCPACRGSGIRDGEDCDSCGADGQLERRFAETIDLGDYKRVRCPLCHGKGAYGLRDECPVCGGEGDLERRLAREVDVSLYEPVKCRLCKGKGTWGDFDACPGCGGEGQLERQADSETDWSQWK